MRWSGIIGALGSFLAALTMVGSAVAEPARGGATTAAFGPWSVTVSVTPATVGRMAVSVRRVRATTDERYPRLIADLRFVNHARGTATFTDHFRTSAFAEGGTGDQLLVADEGCGFGIADRGDPVEPGFCLAYLDVLRIKPGRSGVRTISAYSDLAGMTPLGAGHYEFARRVKFRFPNRPPAKKTLTVGFDVAAP